MRKAEKILRDKNFRMPDKYKKVDTTINGDAKMLAEKQKQVEKKLYPLRIDQRTVIYVTKDKLTPEYAEKKRASMQQQHIFKRKGGVPTVLVDIEELRRMVRRGMKQKEISKELDISCTTVSNYIKKHNLKN